MADHEAFMALALEEARGAERAGEVPVGAVAVRDGVVVARAFNQPIRSTDPTAHAEVLLLRAAAAAEGNYRLPGLTVYVTLEPCLMCVGALLTARVSHLVYGADEPKFGAVRSLLSLSDLKLTHRMEVTPGVLEAESRALVQAFFRGRR